MGVSPWAYASVLTDRIVESHRRLCVERRELRRRKGTIKLQVDYTVPCLCDIFTPVRRIRRKRNEIPLSTVQVQILPGTPVDAESQQWSARQPHKLKAGGSNPPSATTGKMPTAIPRALTQQVRVSEIPPDCSRFESCMRPRHLAVRTAGSCDCRSVCFTQER